jgi:predicted transposase/invertase (TIGR01784 family)
MTTTATPHDALFKAAFSLPENAAAELRHVLGPAIAALFDFSTLRLCSGSFVSEALRARHVDLLFSVRAGGHDVRIYVLCEHQSGPDPWLALWLLGYMVQIWETYLGENPKAQRLPVVLPLVVAHCDGGWRGSTAFEALFVAPEQLFAFVPRFHFALDDLAGQDPEAIKRRDASPFARLALLALQQARRTEHLGRMLRGWIELLRDLRQTPTGRRAYDQIFRYLVEVCGPDADIIDTTATEIDPEVKQIMETYAEMWLRQGRERGREEGRQEGQEMACRMLLRALHRRFGEVSAVVERRVRAADAALLEVWLDRCLDARTLDEVFASS